MLATILAMALALALASYSKLLDVGWSSSFPAYQNNLFFSFFPFFFSFNHYFTVFFKFLELVSWLQFSLVLVRADHYYVKFIIVPWPPSPLKELPNFNQVVIDYFIVSYRSTRWCLQSLLNFTLILIG